MPLQNVQKLRCKYWFELINQTPSIRFISNCFPLTLLFIYFYFVGVQKINHESFPGYKIYPHIQLDPSTTPSVSLIIPEKERKTEEKAFDDFEGGNEMDNAETVENNEVSSGNWIFTLFIL